MKDSIKKLVAILLLGLIFSPSILLAGGMSLIQASDDEITVLLDSSVSGSVRLLEIEPYDSLNPLRGATSSRSDCQQLDLANEGFLRMRFTDSSPLPFDPLIEFPDYRVNADYVGQFSMRVRVSGTQGGADMPFAIYGLPACTYLSIPADGQWHVVRGDMTGADWSGMRTLRIDPANGQSYSVNSNAVVDIDWAAVTYRDDFSGDRNYSGLDVFIDLGMPEASWTGIAQPEIVLPRYNGERDRMFSKYLLVDDANNQIGSARYVTDLSGLSYQTDSADDWEYLGEGHGFSEPFSSNGILVATYEIPPGTWDPGVQADTTQRANVDVADQFVMKYRLTGYQGSQSTVPMGLYGFVYSPLYGAVGIALIDDWIIPDGEWHVYRTGLDHSTGSVSWHGLVKFRIDAPNANETTYPAPDFAGATFELDWVAVSDDPLFTPSRPLCEGGQLWTFSEDRTFPFKIPGSFKGTDGLVKDDFGPDGLGCGAEKYNYLQGQVVNVGLNPTAVWRVDEFDIGINAGAGNYIESLLNPDMKYYTDNDVANIMVSLNSPYDYWLDEGTPNQRFNPLRNRLTIPNAPTFVAADNMLDPVGLAYYRGMFEYMGCTYSDPRAKNGHMYRFIIGNEVDAHYDWYNMGSISKDDLVDAYVVACRMADLALRKYHPDFRVYISLTHYWNRAFRADVEKGIKPKELIDLFAAKAKEEGDFPWEVVVHTYPEDIFVPTFWSDSNTEDDFSSEYISFKNLQMLRRYLQQEPMLYNGQARAITLGEQGFHVPVNGDAEDEAIQAAALAYSLKIVEQVPGITTYNYHRPLDYPTESGLQFGLGTDADGTAPWAYARKRPSWYVLRDYGTTNETATLDPYLAYIPISSWSDINLADIKLQYHFDEADADITVQNIAQYQITNGVFAGVADSADPVIRNLNVNTYGDGQEVVLIRLKTEKNGSWTLFWKRAGDSVFSGSRSVSFPVVASTDFHVYELDLSSETNWVGQNITAWRLDPEPSEGDPRDFEIDYMLFGSVIDFDGDGLPNSEETLVDLDGDGLPNLADLDFNGDGCSDAREKLLGLNPESDDTDGDGMDNDWEIQYGFNPRDNLEAGWDLDFDGFDTLAEYIALTDPTNGLDYFIISGTVAETNIFVDGKPGRSYTLMCSTSLLSNVWNPIDMQVSEIGGMPVMLTDTNSSASAFYRVDVQK